MIRHYMVSCRVGWGGRPCHLLILLKGRSIILLKDASIQSLKRGGRLFTIKELMESTFEV